MLPLLPKPWQVNFIVWKQSYMDYLENCGVIPTSSVDDGFRFSCIRRCWIQNFYEFYRYHRRGTRRPSLSASQKTELPQPQMLLGWNTIVLHGALCFSLPNNPGGRKGWRLVLLDRLEISPLIEHPYSLHWNGPVMTTWKVNHNLILSNLRRRRALFLNSQCSTIE